MKDHNMIWFCVKIAGFLLLIVIVILAIYGEGKRRRIKRNALKKEFMESGAKYNYFLRKIEKLLIFNPEYETKESLEELLKDADIMHDAADVVVLPPYVINEEKDHMSCKPIKHFYEAAAKEEYSYVRVFVKPGSVIAKDQHFLYFKDLILDSNMTETLVQVLNERDLVYFKLAHRYSYKSYHLLLLIPYERYSDQAESPTQELVEHMALT